jgi:hypothetical protein
MTQFGQILNPAAAVVDFVQSADPADLEARANALIASIAAQQPLRLITNITLAGAGDGHTFVLLVEHVAQGTDPNFNLTGGTFPAATTVRCYMASQQDALEAVRAAVSAAGQTIADEQLAGADQGTRFMGCLVLQTPPFQPVAACPAGLIGAVDMNFSLDGSGTTILTDPAIVLASAPAAPLFFDSPSPGVLRYTGPLFADIMLDAHVSLELTDPGTATIAIVQDPLGVPSLVGFGAQGTDAPSISDHAFARAVVPGSAFARFGIRIQAAPSGGTVRSAHLRAIQFCP